MSQRMKCSPLRRQSLRALQVCQNARSLKCRCKFTRVLLAAENSIFWSQLECQTSERITMVETDMMHSVTSLVLVFSMGIIVASATHKTDCFFTGLDLDGALTRVISQLSVHEQQMKRISSYPDILDVECCSIRGLQHLRQYGPLLPYCVNGTRKFQVDLVHDGPIEMIVNWRWYNGIKGTLALGAQLSRLTLQFVVSEQPLVKIGLRLENPLVPVATEMTYAAVEGVGETARAVTAIWSKLLPSLTQRVWNEYFLANLRKAICEVQLDLFGPHEQANLQKSSSTAFTEYTELDACTN